MSVNEDLCQIAESLDHIKKTGMYDVEKYCCSLKHLTSQLEYFYCQLVPNGTGKSCSTYYELQHRPQVHELAYFNIGRGFPKELMDGHWCYILKDLGYKMLVIPCTSIKKNSKACHPEYEMDIKIVMEGKLTKSRIQLTDIRSIDLQRLDLRKSFCKVLTNRETILHFVKDELFED